MDEFPFMTLASNIFVWHWQSWTKVFPSSAHNSKWSPKARGEQLYGPEQVEADLKILFWILILLKIPFVGHKLQLWPSCKEEWSIEFQCRSIIKLTCSKLVGRALVCVIAWWFKFKNSSLVLALSGHGSKTFFTCLPDTRPIVIHASRKKEEKKWNKMKVHIDDEFSSPYSSHAWMGQRLSQRDLLGMW